MSLTVMNMHAVFHVIRSGRREDPGMRSPISGTPDTAASGFSSGAGKNSINRRPVAEKCVCCVLGASSWRQSLPAVTDAYGSCWNQAWKGRRNKTRKVKEHGRRPSLRPRNPADKCLALCFTSRTIILLSQFGRLWFRPWKDASSWQCSSRLLI